MSTHIHDPMEAISIMRDLGLSRTTIDLYLQTRWNDKAGYIKEDEYMQFLRISACKYLKGFRAFRETNPVLAASQLRRYHYCKDDMKGEL